MTEGLPVVVVMALVVVVVSDVSSGGAENVRDESAAQSNHRFTTYL